MEMELSIAMGLSVLNLVMILIILGINVKSYMKMKAQYTLFMIVFAILFALQYIWSLLLFWQNMYVYNTMFGHHVLILTVFQTLAFGYLLWMEWQ